MCQEFHLNQLVVLQVEHPGTFYTVETKMEVVLNNSEFNVTLKWQNIRSCLRILCYFIKTCRKKLLFPSITEW